MPVPGPMTLAQNGDPEMCLSANLMMMLYSPGAVGRYCTEHVPSLLSVHVISAFDGPSTASDRPPGGRQMKHVKQSMTLVRYY